MPPVILTSVLLWAAGQAQDPGVRRSARLPVVSGSGQGVYVVEHEPVTAAVTTADGRPVEVFSSAYNVTVFALPADAESFRINGSEPVPAPGVPPAPVSASARVAILPEGDGLRIRNESDDTYVVTIITVAPEREGSPRRLVAACVIPPAGSRRLTVPRDARLDVLRPSGSGFASWTGLPRGGPAEAFPPPGWNFNAGDLSLREPVRPHLKWMFTGDLEIGVADRTETVMFDGSLLPMTLQFREKEVRALGLGFTWDFTSLAISIEGFAGDWEGTADFSVDPGIPPPITGQTRVRGDLFGFKASFHWPAITYGGGNASFSLGPVAEMLFLYEEIDEVEAADTNPFDALAEWVPAVGLSFSLHVDLGGVNLSLSAAGNWGLNRVEGFFGELAIGLDVFP